MLLGKLWNNYKEKRLKKRLGYCGKDNNILQPFYTGMPQNIFLDDYTLIQPLCNFIIAGGKVVIKKWTSLSFGCTVVTGHHVPTVGINQRVLERFHINDKEEDVLIDEDCWIGTGATLLSGTHLRRGCVVGAKTLVNKDYPPYSVIVGVPGRVIASKFSIDEIIEHEKKLYPEQERFSRKSLEDIFDKHFVGKKSIGLTTISEKDRKILEINKDMQYRI